MRFPLRATWPSRMSKSPLARRNAPPSWISPIPNATADAMTTVAPAVVMVLGEMPHRINARAIGPTSLTKPSLTAWGMTFMSAREANSLRKGRKGKKC